MKTTRIKKNAPSLVQMWGHITGSPFMFIILALCYSEAMFPLTSLVYIFHESEFKL